MRPLAGLQKCYGLLNIAFVARITHGTKPIDAREVLCPSPQSTVKTSRWSRVMLMLDFSIIRCLKEILSVGYGAVDGLLASGRKERDDTKKAGREATARLSKLGSLPR
ncbi:hypothetical protein FB107DRAFT_245404 [Schizophyllum commune]